MDKKALYEYEVKYSNYSKSSEDKNGEFTNRDKFNSKYAVVEGAENNSKNSGVVRSNDGNTKTNVTYKKNKDAEYIPSQHEFVEKFEDESYTNMYANTVYSGYEVDKHFRWGIDEIPYINLGLYRREQTDLALSKDVDNVKLTINNKNYVYPYGVKATRVKNANKWQKTQDDINKEHDGYIGVKYGSQYGNGFTYSRPIYKADVVYEGKENNPKLQAYITYKISVINESTTLINRVNKISDYYDNRLVFEGASYTKTNTGDLGALIQNTKINDKFNDKMNRVEIPLNEFNVEAQNVKDVYVKFRVNREGTDYLAKMFNNNNGSKEDKFINIVEIDSYSVFESRDGKLVTYAAFDRDSNPSNIQSSELFNYDTYQDDTDFAPGFALVVGGVRTLNGNVFLDKDTLKDNIRKGDGVFDHKN